MPDVYRIADRPTPFERELWREFWSYATDPHKAKTAGVRVAQGEAVYAPLAAGDKWTLTLENDGGLNLKTGIENEYDTKRTRPFERNDLTYFVALLFEF